MGGKLKSLFKRRLQVVIGAVVVLAIAATGTVLLYGSHAATPQAGTGSSSTITQERPRSGLSTTQLAVDIANVNSVQSSLGGTIGANGAMAGNLKASSWQSIGEQSPFGHVLHALYIGLSHSTPIQS